MNTNTASARLGILILIMIFFAPVLHAQSSLWEEIELTGHRMKPGYLASIKQSPTLWWIPVGGTAVGGGIITYLLLRDDNMKDELPELIARNDAITVACDGMGTLDVLLNDKGEGLSVSSIEMPPAAIITENEGILTISQLTTVEDFTFGVTIEDRSGQMASSQVNVTVESPAVSSQADSLETPFNTPVAFNVLANDSGPSISVTSHTLPAEGTASIMPDGALTFTPAANFHGTAIFSYAIEGPCGIGSESQVVITVLPPDCDYTASFETTPADCGLANGTITATIDPPGNYAFTWENGQEGPVLENAVAGTYDITVTAIDLHCELAFTAPLNEVPPDYISGIEVIDAICPEPGDIQFEYAPAGPGPWLMTVVHPEGESQFEVEPGLISLSEFLPIEPGVYAISLIDESAGVGCADGFEAELNAVSPLAIELVDIIPPSDPQANDGALIIQVAAPTLPPYNIEVNGSDWGVAFTEEFVMEGFGVGEYTVQLDDALGCVSNLLEVSVTPPVNLQLAFNQILVPIPASAAIEHPANIAVRPYPLFNATANFGQKHQHQLELGVMMPSYFRPTPTGAAPIVRLAYYEKLFAIQPAGFQLQLQGGVQAIWLGAQNHSFSLQSLVIGQLSPGLALRLYLDANIHGRFFDYAGIGATGALSLSKAN